METRVYDIIYKPTFPAESTGILHKRVTATHININEHGQLIVANNYNQVAAFAKDVWIKVEVVKPNEDS